MTASAGKLVLKIQAVNKSNTDQQIEIRSSLPSRITTDADTLRQGGIVAVTGHERSIRREE